VFVRELVQNARDAEAGAVHFLIDARAGGMRVSCRDDGQGMSLDHARRYLFTLYASSKELDRRDAGRFGVGFWSVLRFEPVRIVVRSWPLRGAAWQIALSGTLDEARGSDPPACPFGSGHGTEVVLERPGEDAELLRRVTDAARQSARFATRKRRREQALDLRVNGTRVASDFALPRPSAAFRRGGLRGVVGLGREARVELFARGLRVRSATTLKDLGAGSGASRVRFPETDGLVPQALLDSDDLEPLLARSDVKDDRALRGLLDLAEGELARLVDRQLALARPQAPWRKLARAAFVLAVVTTLILAARVARRAGPTAPAPVVAAAAAPASQSTPALGAAPPRIVLEPFRDPGPGYAGPRANVIPSTLRAPILRYSPPEARPLFAVIRLEDVAAPPAGVRAAGAYAGAPCAADCLEVEMLLESAAGLARLPLATGQLLDPESLRVDDRRASLVATRLGEPALLLDAAGRHVVRYRTGQGAEMSDPEVRTAVGPASLRTAARMLPDGAPEARVEAALAWVRHAVRYSTEPAVVERHSRADAAGRDVLKRALDIGAGDCDVQNAVLAALLQGAGVRARLAIGYVGHAGTVLPALHAWVEWRGADGRWRAADASAAAPLAQHASAAPAAPILAPSHAAAPAYGAGDRGALIGALAAALLAGLGLVASRRVRRSVSLDESHDVARLLQGALTHPEAFRRVPAVFERALVPLHPRGLQPLGDAWDRATRRQLFCSERGSNLARRAAAAGAMVVDLRRPEGRLVADALGASDLDAWDALLRRSQQTPLLQRVERAFRAAGEPLTLRAAAADGAPLLLDLPLRRWRRGVQRTVVLDTSALLPASAEAVFTQAVRLASLLRLPPRRAARVLAPLAARALRERA